MSNDEKTTVAEVQANNKEMEEKSEKQVTETTPVKTENEAENNGKTQQVDAEAAPAAAPNAAATAAAKPAKPTVHKADYEKDVVYLYQFSRTGSTPSPSCFCLKVETWLRMAAIKYQVITLVILVWLQSVASDDAMASPA